VVPAAGVHTAGSYVIDNYLSFMPHESVSHFGYFFNPRVRDLLLRHAGHVEARRSRPRAAWRTSRRPPSVSPPRKTSCGGAVAGAGLSSMGQAQDGAGRRADRVGGVVAQRLQLAAEPAGLAGVEVGGVERVHRGQQRKRDSSVAAAHHPPDVDEIVELCDHLAADSRT